MSQRLTVKVLSREGGPRWICYYNHKRRAAGDTFDLEAPEHFSAKYMEPIGWTPEKYVKPGTKPTKPAPLAAPAKTSLQAAAAGQPAGPGLGNAPKAAPAQTGPELTGPEGGDVGDGATGPKEDEVI